MYREQNTTLLIILILKSDILQAKPQFPVCIDVSGWRYLASRIV